MPTTLSAAAAHDLLLIERLALDAEALLSEALCVAGRLTGTLSIETLIALRRGLASAANAVNVSTSPLAGAMSEAQDALKEDEAPF
jgi:hypothetical protein